jgi:hypothetical protein
MWHTMSDVRMENTWKRRHASGDKHKKPKLLKKKKKKKNVKSKKMFKFLGTQRAVILYATNKKALFCIITQDGKRKNMMHIGLQYMNVFKNG